MDNEIVPYEQALELKKVGFEYISTIFAYDQSGELYTRDGIPHDFNIRGLLSAPTFSQAFRWFRDNFKISGEITSCFYSEGEENKWEFNIYQLDKEDEEYSTLPIFKSYEEAEFECLKKLIEIVKNKKYG
jgi:hypothetical protein